LLWSAPTPVAVLLVPVVLFRSADAPMAVLLFAVLAKRAPFPIAVLKL
jgi:hypothetical protein